MMLALGGLSRRCYAGIGSVGVGRSVLLSAANAVAVASQNGAMILTPPQQSQVQLQLPPLQLQPQQVRGVHSQRQIKKLFRNNPARIRVEKKRLMEESSTESSRTEKKMDMEEYQMLRYDAPPTRVYAPLFNPQFLPVGWSAPPSASALTTLPTYPFQVARTKNKPNAAIGFLPVYSKFRKDGTKTQTVIKKVTGDLEVFVSELRAVLQIPIPKKKAELFSKHYDQVRIRTGNVIEVDGHYCRHVKKWLAGLGF